MALSSSSDSRRSLWHILAQGVLPLWSSSAQLPKRGHRTYSKNEKGRTVPYHFLAFFSRDNNLITCSLPRPALEATAFMTVCTDRFLNKTEHGKCFDLICMVSSSTTNPSKSTVSEFLRSRSVSCLLDCSMALSACSDDILASSSFCASAASSLCVTIHSIAASTCCSALHPFPMPYGSDTMDTSSRSAATARRAVRISRVSVNPIS
mmetsp:Transcript_24908/g.53073  ORF Transcript_24908/g.53073 Transcript_24908/m.53073 type:complete len:207 (+) Transcript_24908:230-850(+)